MTDQSHYHPGADDHLEASMVIIGDEILAGYITDANSPFFVDRLRRHGVPCTWMHVVGDDAGDIDEAIQSELARHRPRLIVTSGGIGSTPDDITFEAVAASLGLGLVEDPGLVERLMEISAWTREEGMDVGEAYLWHLMRMARIPEGSRLMRRGSSWLPAVAIDVDGGCQDGGATVVILPGVPSEFQRLLTEVVEPEFLEGRNEIPTVIEIEHGLPESSLNVAFAELIERFPNVKLGSYPGNSMLVRLTGTTVDVEAAADLVRGAIAGIESTPAGARLIAAWAARRRRRRDEEDA